MSSAQRFRRCRTDGGSGPGNGDPRRRRVRAGDRGEIKIALTAIGYPARDLVGKPYIMGHTAEFVAQKHAISREEMDEVSAASHERAANATKDGILADEIAPVSIPQRKGDPMVVDTDEHPRIQKTESGFELAPSGADRDLFVSVRRLVVDDLRREPEYAAGYQESPRLATYYAVFNAHRGPLSDRTLRRKLVRSFDVFTLSSRSEGTSIWTISRR